MGEYADGSLGEVFIDMHKTGAAFHSLMNCFAILVSLCLQHGVPLSLLVKRFAGLSFEPQGPVTGHDGITEARSVIDFVFQVLARDYPEQAAE
jgi:ribonucleoside-diphosphate reductase alpha chain